VAYAGSIRRNARSERRDDLSGTPLMWRAILPKDAHAAPHQKVEQQRRLAVVVLVVAMVVAVDPPPAERGSIALRSCAKSPSDSARNSLCRPVASGCASRRPDVMNAGSAHASRLPESGGDDAEAISVRVGVTKKNAPAQTVRREPDARTTSGAKAAAHVGISSSCACGSTRSSDVDQRIVFLHQLRDIEGCTDMSLLPPPASPDRERTSVSSAIDAPTKITLALSRSFATTCAASASVSSRSPASTEVNFTQKRSLFRLMNEYVCEAEAVASAVVLRNARSLIRIVT